MHSEDNIIAALEHKDRIREIALSNLTSSVLETISSAMQEPFPVLSCLELGTVEDTAPVVADSFLRGPAPCLRS
jgi:hypothetical protein